MHKLRAVFSLAVLPALLTPGGLGVRLCFCDGLVGFFRAQGVHQCCPKSQIPQPSSCCSGLPKGDNPPRGASPIAAEDAQPCTCPVLTAPEQAVFRAPAEKAPEKAPLTAGSRVIAELPALVPPVLGMREAVIRKLPPPTSEQRHLPLRI